MQKRLGVALDMGTTTVQGKLIDLDDKRALAYFSSLNEQLPHGHDIISRIKFCLEKPTGLEKLHSNAISSINFIIDNLVSIAREDKEDIHFIAAVGNAALYHFTLSLSPEKLIKPPYDTEHKKLVSAKAVDLGIEAGRDCEFNFLPNIAGFVGSDAIAVILASGLDRSESPVLAIDLGTNGEIVLGSKDRILVTSTAAGPAFEGWHVSCGMRAVEGAIEAVLEKDGGLDLKVIGDGPPKGISGSGLVDILAILIRKGIIDRSGAMQKEFIIHEKEKKIFISPNDVREVQLAKAAFSVGISRLRRFAEEEVSKLFITGKFGRSLNKENAMTVGIIPKDIGVDMTELLERGALKGAGMFVANKWATASRIKDILNKTEHVRLGQDKDFQKEFAEAMKF